MPLLTGTSIFGLESARALLNVVITMSLYHIIWTHARTHARMHACIQPFYGSLDFIRDYLGEPVLEETFTQATINHKIQQQRCVV